MSKSNFVVYILTFFGIICVEGVILMFITDKNELKKYTTPIACGRVSPLSR